MGTGSLPGVESSRGVTLTPHPLLMPMSKNRVAVPLLSLRDFVAYKKGETYQPTNLTTYLLQKVAVNWVFGNTRRYY
jgi:hypothetical protein